MAHKTRQLQMIWHKEKRWQEEGRSMFIYCLYDQQQGGEEATHL